MKENKENRQSNYQKLPGNKIKLPVDSNNHRNNYEKLPGNNIKLSSNNKSAYNEYARENKQWHAHISTRDKIILIVVAIIALFAMFGGCDGDGPSETTISTPKQTTTSQDTIPAYKNPIKRISLGYSTDDTIELDSGDYDYVYFKFNTSNYKFDDIELVNSNPDVCRFEIYDDYPSATLDCKIYSLSAGESIIYVQTSDGSVKSPEIKITVNPNPETTTKPTEATTQPVITTPVETTTKPVTTKPVETTRPSTTKPIEPTERQYTYIINTSTKKFHYSDCSRLPTKNRSTFTGTRTEIIRKGYEPCGYCDP